MLNSFKIKRISAFSFVIIKYLTIFATKEQKNNNLNFKNMTNSVYTNGQGFAICPQKYTKKFINSNFLIKVYGLDENGKKVNKLYGVSGICKMIGAEMFEKFVGRALKSGQDCTICKLRRGLQVSLYVH